MKFIMSFAVIAIHSQYLAQNPQYYEWFDWFISLAVPFFFIVTGYFTATRLQSYKLNSEGKTYLRTHMNKSLRLYCSWLLVYLPITLIFYLHSGRTLASSISNLAYSILICGESPFAWTLWYIYSTTFFFLIARWLYYRKGGKIIMYIIFFGAYLIGFLWNNDMLYIPQSIGLLCIRALWGVIT